MTRSRIIAETGEPSALARRATAASPLPTPSAEWPWLPNLLDVAAFGGVVVDDENVNSHITFHKALAGAEADWR